jgi:hypothetical protein
MDLCKVIFKTCFLSDWQLFYYNEKTRYDVVGVFPGKKEKVGEKRQGENLMDFLGTRSCDGNTN